ncbi:MAG: hypothetical protein IPH53_17870 [Flavobacteriales bacterium]|nr:hypothetical protein [Flavobacteriales bacterium]
MNLQPHITRTLFQAALIVAGISLCNLANAQAYVAFEGARSCRTTTCTRYI